MSKLPIQAWSEVSHTLLVALYLRAMESQRPDGMLKDEKAVELVSEIDYDFSRLKSTTFGQVFAAMRVRQFDRYTCAFLQDHPDGVVVEIGCGLDTRFHRVDNGQVDWYSLDFPEVIELRRQLLNETPRNHFIACSALEFNWMDTIPVGHPLLFQAEGVFPYLEVNAVKCLILALQERFSGAELIFDALPTNFIRFSRLHPALKATHARLNWGLDDSKDLEKWRPGIQLIDEWFYFDEPEPRLGWYRLLKWFSPVSQTKIVHYRFNVR